MIEALTPGISELTSLGGLKHSPGVALEDMACPNAELKATSARKSGTARRPADQRGGDETGSRPT